MDTADAIRQYHPDTPYYAVPELRESDIGEFTGKSKKELGLDPGKSGIQQINPQQGESLDDVYNRAKTFLDKTLHTHRDQTVLYVAHNFIDKVLLAVINGQTVQHARDAENLKNTSITVLDVDEDKNHNIILYNCTKHLA